MRKFGSFSLPSAWPCYRPSSFLARICAPPVPRRFFGDDPTGSACPSGLLRSEKKIEISSESQAGPKDWPAVQFCAIRGPLGLAKIIVFPLARVFFLIVEILIVTMVAPPYATNLGGSTPSSSPCSAPSPPSPPSPSSSSATLPTLAPLPAGCSVCQGNLSAFSRWRVRAEETFSSHCAASLASQRRELVAEFQAREASRSEAFEKKRSELLVLEVQLREKAQELLENSIEMQRRIAAAETAQEGAVAAANTACKHATTAEHDQLQLREEIKLLNGKLKDKQDAFDKLKELYQQTPEVVLQSEITVKKYEIKDLKLKLKDMTNSRDHFLHSATNLIEQLNLLANARKGCPCCGYSFDANATNASLVGHAHPHPHSLPHSHQGPPPFPAAEEGDGVGLSSLGFPVGVQNKNENFDRADFASRLESLKRGLDLVRQTFKDSSSPSSSSSSSSASASSSSSNLIHSRACSPTSHKTTSSSGSSPDLFPRVPGCLPLAASDSKAPANLKKTSGSGPKGLKRDKSLNKNLNLNPSASPTSQAAPVPPPPSPPDPSAAATTGPHPSSQVLKFFSLKEELEALLALEVYTENDRLVISLREEMGKLFDAHRPEIQAYACERDGGDAAQVDPHLGKREKEDAGARHADTQKTRIGEGQPRKAVASGPPRGRTAAGTRLRGLTPALSRGGPATSAAGRGEARTNARKVTRSFR
eukprot:GHVT01075894.1.p1 GENE.GHVT01075894.1~~GHVT01075894.1.p1  ORF type:complete len:704 (-),score=153.98 GHVT01075894.1:135-2246(-)